MPKTTSSTVLRTTRAPVTFALSVVVSALLATYLTIMVTTVVLAAVQTRVAADIRETATELTRLESSYYAAIAQLHTADATALGFVTPENVAFVTETRVAGLTFAR